MPTDAVPTPAEPEPRAEDSQTLSEEPREPTDYADYLFTPVLDRLGRGRLLTMMDEEKLREQMHIARQSMVTIEGPLLSDDMHRLVADVWMVPHSRDLKVANPVSDKVLGSIGGLLLCIPIVGWLLLAILGIPAWLKGRAKAERFRQYLEGELADPARPWAWTLRRTGLQPWPVVSVPWRTAQELGLRHPARAGDDYIVEQVERTKQEAIAAATRAVNFGA